MVRWFSGSLVLAYINIYTRTEPGFPPRALVENFSQIMQNFLNHNRFAKRTVATLERELRTKWHSLSTSRSWVTDETLHNIYRNFRRKEGCTQRNACKQLETFDVKLLGIKNTVTNMLYLPSDKTHIRNTSARSSRWRLLSSWEKKCKFSLKCVRFFLHVFFPPMGAVQNSRSASERGRVFPEFRACAAQASFPLGVYPVTSCRLSAGVYIYKIRRAEESEAWKTLR